MNSRMKKRTAALLSASMLLMGSCGTALAADDDSVVLTRAEYQTLMDRISKLESRLDQTEKNQQASETKVETLEKPPPMLRQRPKKTRLWTGSSPVISGPEL